MLAISRLAHILRPGGTAQRGSGDDDDVSNVSGRMAPNDTAPERGGGGTLAEVTLSGRGGGGRRHISSRRSGLLDTPGELLLLLRLLPLAASRRHLQAFTPRHLCAVLSSLAWMEHLLLPPPTTTTGEGQQGDDVGGAAPSGGGRGGDRESSSDLSSPDVHQAHRNGRSAVSTLLQRGAGAMRAASADDACRMLWAAARLRGGGRALRGEGELLASFAQAASKGIWQPDRAEGSRVPGNGAPSSSSPIPTRLLPTLLWSTSNSPPEHLRRDEVQQLLSQLLLSGGKAGEVEEAGNSSVGSGVLLPMLAQPDVLSGIPTEGLVTALYSIGLMCGVASGSAPASLSIANQQGAGEAASSHTSSSREQMGDDGDSDGVPAVRVSAAVVDALCDAVLGRATGGGGGGGGVPLLPRSVANVAWALARLGHRHSALLFALAARAKQILRGGAAAAVCAIAEVPVSGSSGRKVPPRPEGRRPSPSPSAFTPQELANLMSALARLDAHTPSLVAQVHQWVLLRNNPPPRASPSSSSFSSGAASLPMMTPRDASELLYALATMWDGRDGAAVESVWGPDASVTSPPECSGTRIRSQGQVSPLAGDPSAASRQASDVLAAVVAAGARQRLDHVRRGRGWEECGPQLLVGAVWALARLGRPLAGGILELTVRSLEEQLQQQQGSDEAEGSIALPPLLSSQWSLPPPPPPPLLPPPPPLLPLAQLLPEDVARLCWALATAETANSSSVGRCDSVNGSSEPWPTGDDLSFDDSGDRGGGGGGRQGQDSPGLMVWGAHGGRRRRDCVLKLLEAEAVEWSPSMDDQVWGRGIRV